MVKRFDELDGLRGVAISLVVTSHLLTPPLSADGGRLRVIAGHLGLAGVDCFFVISGFLITWLLLRERQRDGSVSLRQFYERRAFRILPAATVFLAAISALRLAGISNASPTDVLASLCFCKNLVGNGYNDVSHFWTLAVEEQFYIVWPVCFVLIPAGRSRWAGRIALGAALTIPFWRQLQFRVWGADHVNGDRADLCIEPILFGCYLAFLRSADPGAGRARWLTAARSRTVWGLAVAVVGLYCFTGLFQRPVVRFFQSICLAASLFYIVAAATNGLATPANRVLRSGVLRWIGYLSFSLYLWQQPFCLRSGSLRTAPALDLLAVLGIACGSYYFVEQPALRLRRRFGVASEVPPPAPPDAAG